MLRRIDIVGFVGIASVVLGLLFFIVGRYYPAHSNIWRDWLLAFVLVMLGSALAVAWLLIRVSGTGIRGPEEQRQRCGTGAQGSEYEGDQQSAA